MIKVLEVLEATVGGTRRHVVSLVAGLDKSHFQVEVAAPSIRQGTIADKDFVDEIKSLGIHIHVINMIREIQLSSDLKALWNLLNLIRREKYNIVHVHSSKAGFLGRIAAKLNGIPTVYTPNGFYFLDSSNCTKKEFYLLLERLAGKLTDKLIAVSSGEGQQAVLRGIVPVQKLTVIPNAINFQDFQPNPDIKQRIKVELGIPASSTIVGTVSRYIAQKNPFSLVQVFAQIHQKLPEVHFIWCGEGEMRAETENLAKELRVFDAISFLGYQENIQAIMNTFDVFLLASLFEGLPYTILEAMALSIPVVATDVVGSRDVVQHETTGILVPLSQNQDSELAEAVMLLLKDESKRILFGERGQDRIKEKYSLENMVKETENLYCALLQTSS